MKPHYLFFLIIILFSFCSLTCEPRLQDLDTVTITIEPEKDYYKIGEVFKITFQGSIDNELYDKAFIKLLLNSRNCTPSSKIFIKNEDDINFTEYFYDKNSPNIYLSEESFDNFKLSYYFYVETPDHYFFNLEFYAEVKEDLRLNTPNRKTNYYFTFDAIE